MAVIPNHHDPLNNNLFNNLCDRALILQEDQVPLNIFMTEMLDHFYDNVGINDINTSERNLNQLHNEIRAYIFLLYCYLVEDIYNDEITIEVCDRLVNIMRVIFY
jgi:hypothetical protein